MANKFITVPPGTLEHLFPFHFAIDRNGMVVSAGASIAQKCSDLSGKGLLGGSVDSIFKFVNPKITWTHEEIRKNLNALILLEHKLHPCQLRGQFIYMPDDDLMMFLGSPWLTSTRQLEEFGLTFESFAMHDATIDMLHTYQASLNAIADSHLLQEKLRKKNLALQDRSIELMGIMNALDHFLDAVFVFNKWDCSISYANKSACKLMGLTKEKLTGSSFELFIDQFLDDQYKEKLQAFLGDCFAKTYPVSHQNGLAESSVWEARINVAKDNPNLTHVYDITLQEVAALHGVGSIIANIRDVTEQVQAGRANRRSERLESLGKLSGGIAHDLNNALAPISLSLSSLRRLNPNQGEIIDLMQSSVKRAADMVRQLVAFSKGIEGERLPVQVQSLINEISSLIRASFPKTIALQVECPAKLPVVLGDATQIHQVLLNLCVNARDAISGEGVIGIKVYETYIDEAYAIQLRGVEEINPGRYLAIQVQDTGMGIAPEVLDKIFDPFFTTKSPDQGTGLGLSTVMGIVKSHGGFTEVDSTLGKGATFTIYFPVDGTEQSLSDTATYRKPKFFGNGEMVLVVDDEQTIRESTCMLLRQFNLMPVAADDGVDAMAKLSDHRDQVRLIVTDVHMPHMDGVQLVMSARKLISKVPIIVCSGRMDAHVEAKLSHMEGVYRLNKPFHEADLLELIESALAPIQAEAF